MGAYKLLLHEQQQYRDPVNEVDCSNTQKFYESTCRQLSHDRKFY